MRMLFALVLALLGGLACAAPIRLGERTVVVPMGKAGAVVPVDMTTAGGPAPARTTATVRWSASGLTVAFACTDDDVVRNLRPRDDPDMWMDDCVEIFLDPGHTHDDMSRWVHVLVNAAGSIHDERGPTIGYKGAGTSLGGDTAFNLPGLTAAAAKTTDGWSAEIFIPWKDLGGPPKAGDAWGFNLCREDYPGDRYLCWSPTFGPFNQIHRWGHLVFAGSLPSRRLADDARARIAARHAALRAVGLDTELTRYFDTRGLVRETWPGKEDYLAKPPECVTATIAPAGIGVQMVRLALPLPDRFLHDGQRLVVADGRGRVTASVRPLSWYGRMIKLEQPPYNTLPSVVQNVQGEEPPSVRRALVTFPYTFKDLQPVAISLQPAPAGNTRPRLPVTVRVQGDTLIIAYRRGPTLTARLIAPPAAAPRPVEVQTVESNAHILWQLYRTEDADWSRILDVRADAQGTVAVTAYLQRSPAVISPYNGEKSAFDIRFTTAPDFGWDIATRSAPSGLDVHTTITRFATEAAHDFAGGQGCAFLFDDWRYQLYHPVAPFTRRGSVRVTRDGGATAYRYLRCSAADRVPMQSTAWRRAEFVVAPAGAAALSPTMAYPHGLRVDWRLWDGLYGTGAPLDLARQPALAGLVRFHHDAIVASTAHGDDFGNITSFDPAAPHRAVYHMLRLNHGPEIFFEGWRSGDRRLVDAGVLWCQNFRDMSIWWGPQGYGGTRYPYAGAQPKDFGRDFGWRSDEGLAPYCLKGIDAFFLAYEETGDPLMLEALGAQAQYAARFVHTSKKPGDGNPRSIGVVLDFVRLYRYTGQPRYLDEALRLFRELRDSGALTGDQLFTESGGPPTAQLRFIPHDGAIGETFYKPYILGYGLEGLPELAVLCPTEPRLRETVRALADFMAKSADSLGAWRYPHPRSPGMLINQAPEHAAQLMNAGRALGTSEAQLDAIEAALRLRLHGWQKTGAILGLSPWEAGPDGRATVAWETRYTLATERDAARDYAEGAVNAGGAPIEGLVYVPDVLRFYLAHRPAARLLAPPAPEAPLGQVLSRANAPAP